MPAEWLVRKLFKIEKPQKDKRKTTAVKNGEAEKIDPVLDARAAVAEVAATAAPLHGASVTAPAPAASVAPAPLQAVRETYPAAMAAPVEKQGKPTIFNFAAWFAADPVKSSLLLGLSFLSWLATYTGMLELIQANTGQLEIFARVAIGFSVLMLMLMILYLLDSLYSNTTPGWLKPVFVGGYMFLTLISVGFGFGFYWKYLEAQTEATRSAESAVSQVQVSLQLGQTRLEQLQDTFAQLAVLSKSKADQERDKGNTCPNSRPGEGPRMRLRDEDSQKFGYSAEYITSRVATVKNDLTALNGDLKKVVTRDATTVAADGTRNEFLRELGRKLDMTIARFNALATDPQIRQFRESFDKRAGTTVFPSGTGEGTFSCPDTQLQTALRGVVRAIDDIPEIKNPKVAAVEGSEAIVEAFRRLAVTLAALPTLKLPPSPEELRKQRTAAISAGRANAEISNVEPGLSGRDYIPLSAAVFVDLCILLISLNRRNDQFDEFHRSVASAKSGHIGTTMLEIFEAHQNEVSQEMLEIFHQAEFEFGGDYYLAVPLIKGSREAAYLALMQAKEDEINRSKQETLDERIGIHEDELARRTGDQTEAERMKKQIVDYVSHLSNHRATLQQNQRQLAITYQQQPQHAALVAQGERLTAEIGDVNGQLTMLGKRLEDTNRLLHGTGELVRQTKQELTTLRHRKTILHEEEQFQLRKRIGVNTEIDLAKEARFLSNLCVSLEANSILHLAGLWPMQSQVRGKLKSHNSRYYHPDRSYRVYRFRKVADTQSQMVLDLIMEAARRARESGEIAARNRPATPVQAAAPAAPTEPTVDAELERERLDVERQRQELARTREAMEQQMAAQSKELNSVLELLKERVQPQPGPAEAHGERADNSSFHINRDAEDLPIIDGKKLRARQTEAKTQEQGRKLAEIVTTRIGDDDEQKRDAARSPGDQGLGAQMAAIEALMREQMGRSDDAKAGAMATARGGHIGGRGFVGPARAALDRLADVAAHLRGTHASSHGDDVRDRVNIGSIPVPAPAHEEAPLLTPVAANDTEPAPVEQPEQPVSNLQRQLRESIGGRLQKMREEQDTHDRGHKASVYQDAFVSVPQPVEAPDEPAAAAEQPAVAAIEQAPAAQAKLTEPVDVATSITLNQDTAGSEPEPLVREIAEDDEPSEADHFIEGELPSFLRADIIMDDASEETGTRNIAERFRPTTKGD